MVSKDKVCKLIFEIRVYNLVLAYLSAAHLLIPTHALVAITPSGVANAQQLLSQHLVAEILTFHEAHAVHFVGRRV